MMGLLVGGLVLLVIALWVRAVVDCVRTPSERVRHVPKVVWLLFILHAPLLGAIVWVNVGKGPAPEGGTAKTVRPEAAFADVC